MGRDLGHHLQLEQDEDEQLPQPPPELDDADASPEDFPMPKRDRHFLVSFDPHCGQRTSGFDPKTSFSKQLLHLLH
jgi:hypothetical protein